MSDTDAIARMNALLKAQKAAFEAERHRPVEERKSDLKRSKPW